MTSSKLLLQCIGVAFTPNAAGQDTTIHTTYTLQRKAHWVATQGCLHAPLPVTEMVSVPALHRLVQKVTSWVIQRWDGMGWAAYPCFCRSRDPNTLHSWCRRDVASISTCNVISSCGDLHSSTTALSLTPQTEAPDTQALVKWNEFYPIFDVMNCFHCARVCYMSPFKWLGHRSLRLLQLEELFIYLEW